MRPRSKSMVLNNSNSLSESDIYEEEETNDVDSKISEMIIDKILQTLPKDDHAPYAATLKKFDWSTIGFENKSADELKKHLEHAIKNVSKIRTLTEILKVAKTNLHTLKNHPDRPKRPRTAFAIYLSEKYTEVKSANPGLENTELMKKISENFRNLSEKKIAKYQRKRDEQIEAYNLELKQFKQRHPDVVFKKSKKEADKTSPLAFYWEDRSKELGKTDLKAYQMVRKEWSELDIKTKAIYIRKYFEGDTKSGLSKHEKKQYMEARGAPQRPQSAYAAFVQDHISSVQRFKPIDRMKELGKIWKALDDKVRQTYLNKASIELEVYKQKLERFMKSLSEEELNWINEKEKETTKRKRNDENNEEMAANNGAEPPTKKSKGKEEEEREKISEPEKPPEDPFDYYVNIKFDGDRKAAKKKWKTLKESKKQKYYTKLENIQKEYFEQLKVYLKSLTPSEIKKYKKRMKSKQKTKPESDNNNDSDSS